MQDILDATGLLNDILHIIEEYALPSIIETEYKNMPVEAVCAITPTFIVSVGNGRVMYNGKILLDNFADAQIVCFTERQNGEIIVCGKNTIYFLKLTDSYPYNTIRIDEKYNIIEIMELESGNLILSTETSTFMLVDIMNLGSIILVHNKPLKHLQSIADNKFIGYDGDIQIIDVGNRQIKRTTLFTTRHVINMFFRNPGLIVVFENSIILYHNIVKSCSETTVLSSDLKVQSCDANNTNIYIHTSDGKIYQSNFPKSGVLDGLFNNAIGVACGEREISAYDNKTLIIKNTQGTTHLEIDTSIKSVKYLKNNTKIILTPDNKLMLYDGHARYLQAEANIKFIEHFPLLDCLVITINDMLFIFDTIKGTFTKTLKPQSYVGDIEFMKKLNSEVAVVCKYANDERLYLWAIMTHELRDIFEYKCLKTPSWALFNDENKDENDNKNENETIVSRNEKQLVKNITNFVNIAEKRITKSTNSFITGDSKGVIKLYNIGLSFIQHQIIPENKEGIAQFGETMLFTQNDLKGNLIIDKLYGHAIGYITWTKRYVIVGYDDGVIAILDHKLDVRRVILEHSAPIVYLAPLHGICKTEFFVSQDNTGIVCLWNTRQFSLITKMKRFPISLQHIGDGKFIERRREKNLGIRVFI